MGHLRVSAPPHRNPATAPLARLPLQKQHSFDPRPRRAAHPESRSGNTRASFTPLPSICAGSPHRGLSVDLSARGAARPPSARARPAVRRWVPAPLARQATRTEPSGPRSRAGFSAPSHAPPPPPASPPIGLRATVCARAPHPTSAVAGSSRASPHDKCPC